MRTNPTFILTLTVVGALTLPALAQQPAAPQGASQTPAAGAAQTTAKPSPKDTEVWEPACRRS